MDKETKKELFYNMLLIRKFEEKLLESFAYGKLAGSMFHVSIGQEAVPAGVCSVLRKTDYITSTHRGHGHMLIKGGDLNLMMAEMYGRYGGYCKGKGGSMHIADINLGHLGANGIVGGGLAIATGAAYASALRNDGKITVCFFGDGAVNEGIFHESLNMAGVWNLPIVYVCENNRYALSTPMSKTHAAKNVSDRAPAYGMTGISIDGMDVEAVRKIAEEAVDRARKGKGPTLIECKTYRFYGHSRGDASIYRTKKEENAWKSRCPIASYSKKLIAENILTEKVINDMEVKITEKLNMACDFAEKSPYPTIDTLYDDIYEKEVML